VEGGQRKQLCEVGTVKSALPKGETMNDNKIPDLPEVQVEDPHWKVGDGMNNPKGKPNYIIGQIAVVAKGKQDGKPRFDVVIFDTQGRQQGRLHLVEQS
jgi:hypothetical protein